MASSSRWANSHHPPISGSHTGKGRLAGILPGRVWVISLLIAMAGAVLTFLLVQNAREVRTASELRFIPTMAYPGETWTRAAPDSVGINPGKLENALAWFEKRAPSDGVEKVAIVRYGKLVWAGDRASEVQGIWSATKSFSGTLLCALADDGICQPKTRIADLLPEMAEHYPDTTLRHFVTMTSGYQAEGDWPPPIPTYRNGSSNTPFTPSAPQFEAGTRFSYWDSAMNVYGMAVTRAAGESLESLFRRKIADPIGMNPDQWRWLKFTETDGIIVNGGSGNKRKHIEISALELARFGHLLLNRGSWNGQQVLSEPMVEAATTVQVPADLPLGGPIAHLYGERFPFDGRGAYGFNWWVNGVKPDGRRFWPGVPEKTFGAMGYNNNRLFVIPEWNMVVVRLGLDGKEKRVLRGEFAGFLKRIGRAIED